MSTVQSLAPVMPSGFGANRPAISTLLVPTRRYEQFSQMQPPCIAVETITAGNATAGRSSMAQRMNVCVPPPLAPVTPMRFGSTSGRLQQEIEGADAVPRLQAHEALQAQFGVGVE